MTERPDPERLLAQLQRAETLAKRGKLKVFLGAAPGVGKTYAMLLEARQRDTEGDDVLIGVAETHGRGETAALLGGLLVLPKKKLSYRGRSFEELDLEAALARRPQLLVVDELAHSNVPGSRHVKRWQDVQDLLRAGIDVYTTLNVQHLESLNDVIQQITGIRPRETVPDTMLERADEIAMIDLPPDALLERLAEGKVYVPERAESAVHAFFKKGNLIALRELALRRAAERVDQDVDEWRKLHGIEATWPAGERVMVCVSPSPMSRRLIRAAKRLADRLRAEWVAVFVETPAQVRTSDEDRERVNEHLRLAEGLGADAVTLSGEVPARALLAYAREHNVTRILLGKPTHPRWRDLLFGSLIDDLIRGSGDVDVHVVSGEPEVTGPSIRPPRPPVPWQTYGAAALSVGVTTVVAGLMFGHFEASNLVMVYLLGIMQVALRHGRGPSLLAAALSVGAFDFCFVPPRFTFAVSDVRYLVTFAVMFVVGLVISGLTVRIRAQAGAAMLRERRTAALYELSRRLASAAEPLEISAITTRQIDATFEARSIVLVTDAKDEIRVLGDTQEVLGERERALAQWTFEHRQAAGLGTDTLPSSTALCVPLTSMSRTIGAVAVTPKSGRPFDPDQRHLLEVFCHQAAVALERASLAEDAKRSEVRARTEEIRSSLLSSVSHDLRTPLAVITSAASTLSDPSTQLSDELRRDIGETIVEEAERTNRLVTNLLEMTRLEAGVLAARKEWVSIEEVIGAALDRLDKRLQGRPVEVTVKPGLPLVALDEVLVEQLLLNLLDNALKYTPAGSPIEVSAGEREGMLTLAVADRGPGVPPGDEERVFEKFHRGAQGTSGTGLGLTICRGIAVAHGGSIRAVQRQGGGACFLVELPLGDAPPAPPPEVAA